MKSAAVAALSAVAFAWPQDPPPPAVLQKAQTVAQTDAHHARLQRLVGEWEVVLTTKLRGEPPREDRGSVRAAAILGGRYVVADYTLAITPATVHAVQIFGFDALRQLWTSSWRDDLSTWSVECSGPPSQPEAGVLTLRGSLVDASEPTGRPFRQVVDLSAEGVVVVRLYDTHEGVEFELQRQRWTKR
jgi:hypothetical protein